MVVNQTISLALGRLGSQLFNVPPALREPDAWILVASNEAGYRLWTPADETVGDWALSLNERGRVRITRYEGETRVAFERVA